MAARATTKETRCPSRNGNACASASLAGSPATRRHALSCSPRWSPLTVELDHFEAPSHAHRPPAFPLRPHLIAPFAAFTGALLVALVAAVALPLHGLRSGRRLTRHADGHLGIHVWPSGEPWQLFDAWTTKADGESVEGWLHVDLLGYTVEVWFTDPRSATAEVLRRFQSVQ